MTRQIEGENVNPTGPGDPHNREAEESLLGAVLISPEQFIDCAAIVEPPSFYIHRNRWIWEAFGTLTDKKRPIDTLTVSEELERHGRLAEAGGAAYLAVLIDSVPTSLHATAYAEIVREQAIRRRLLAGAGSIAKGAHDQEAPIQETVGLAEQMVLEVTDQQASGDPVPIQTVVSEHFDRMEYVAQHPEDADTELRSGYLDLDGQLGLRLRRGYLILIAARPGLGKSSMLLDLAEYAGKQKKTVALFSLEMTEEEQAQRMMMRLMPPESGITFHELADGPIQERDWGDYTKACAALSELPIYLDDTAGLTPIQLHSKCRRLDLLHGLGLVIVDYLQLMEPDVKSRRAENRVQEVSYISRQLKQLARNLRVPVVAAAQLSRAVEQRNSKKPQLSDLRESGSLEQDADVVIFLHRPEQDQAVEDFDQGDRPGEGDGNRDWIPTEALVAKHRNGPTGSAQLVFHARRTTFVDGTARKVRPNAGLPAKPERARKSAKPSFRRTETYPQGDD